MIAATVPEDQFSGIALAKFGSFAEVVHGPDLAFGKSTDLVITRSRKAAAKPIGEGFKPPNEPTLPISSKPDPRLIALRGHAPISNWRSLSVAPPKTKVTRSNRLTASQEFPSHGAAR
jgi:hypothetical protein